MELTVIEQDNKLLIDSREVAEMVGKQHKDLMRDIRNYIKVLEDPGADLRPANFFIENSYTDANNQVRPSYLLTKQGCEMVGNKMTGQKGILFTAAYVSKFNEMEQKLFRPMTTEELLEAQFKYAREIKEKVDSLDNKIEDIKEVVGLNVMNWRKDTNSLINKIALNGFGSYSENKVVRSAIYDELERRADCKLGVRLTNKRRRMAEEGICKSKRDKLNFVDVIADDKRLVEIYIAVVKDFAVKYGVKKATAGTVA